MKTSAESLQKWGGLASFLLAGTFVIPSLIYLVGDLRTTFGPFGYALADFLYGPVWAASLVTAVLALRERLDEYAPRRMQLAFLTALGTAGAFLAVACIRAANRHYHLMHPELHLEESSTVLIVWTTLVAGVIGTAFHGLGWAWVLLGSVGWTSGRLPRVLSALYWTAGAAALFVYVQPELEGAAILLGVVVSIWQGFLLWKGAAEGTQVPRQNASQPGQA